VYGLKHISQKFFLIEICIQKLIKIFFNSVSTVTILLWYIKWWTFNLWIYVYCYG